MSEGGQGKEAIPSPSKYRASPYPLSINHGGGTGELARGLTLINSGAVHPLSGALRAPAAPCWHQCTWAKIQDAASAPALRKTYKNQLRRGAADLRMPGNVSLGGK